MSQVLGDVATWVTGRLKRPDLQERAVEDAANFYLVLASSVPFEVFETTSLELPISSDGKIILDSQTNGLISVRLTNGIQTRRLRRSHVRVYDSLSGTVPGVPATYARWNLQLEVNPVPPNGSAMTVRVRYRQNPTLTLNTLNTYADNVIIIPQEWIELMRYETLFRTYCGIEQFDKANLLVAPVPMPRQNSPLKTRVFEYGIIPKLWNDLLRTISQREAGDEDFGINPVVRRYTFGG